MRPLIVHPPKNKINGDVNLPTSKSMANRYLIIKALSNNLDTEFIPSQSEDSILLHKLLNNLHADIDAGDAGTVYRFLTAFLSCKPGEWNLSGSDRMLERPIGPLVNALIQAGANISFSGKTGYPPLKIHGKPLNGGLVKIDGDLSSQFITAILLVAPYMEQGINLILTSRPSSVPYIQMTIEFMRRLGISVNWEGDTIVVEPGVYKENSIKLESDWSAAAFFFELCALSKAASIQIRGLSEESIQGDSRLWKIMQNFNVDTIFGNSGLHIEKLFSGNQVSNFLMNCNEIPDLVPALVCTCAGLGIDASFSGIHTLLIKESNRIIALQTELRKLGLKSDYDAKSDILRIHKGRLKPYKGTLRTYNDHRIAMSLAPLALVCGELSLDDGSVVAKSFPSYWEQLTKLGFNIEDVQVKSEF
ncbi:MAG: 3-phosphoshikimate 1-carboxyvinyltransferase [Bacteroidetes bacterium]|nr:MAG: 3-phosphoshikimate 1-carboxyvinyltransferase [Bacteroidota bacterium]